MPGPFDGIFATVKETYEFFLDRANGYEFRGKPVRVAYPGTGLGCDGPLTVALDVRGDEIFSDMYAEPDYYHRLMDFIVESTIRRVRAWRAYLGLEMRPPAGSFADDAIQMISVDTYKELVLPYHKRYLDALFSGGPFQMHLCGNVQRHFPQIIHALNVNHFDTGFPINFETLRDKIGETIHINGGVRVDILLSGTSAQVREETRRILQSGVTRGGKFIMKEANNLPPNVPLENLWAMYETTREFGVYQY
jgi:uroporphyrinogen-III decarboxylase